MHCIFEAMRRAFAARNEKLGDPDFVKPVDRAAPVAARSAPRSARSITTDHATPSTRASSGRPARGGEPHTTHFSVVDGRGNAVALTTTLNWLVRLRRDGGRRAASCSTTRWTTSPPCPGTPNSYGLVQGEPNAIAPGKRMLSSMSPTIVLDTDAARCS